MAQTLAALPLVRCRPRIQGVAKPPGTSGQALADLSISHFLFPHSFEPCPKLTFIHSPRLPVQRLAHAEIQVLVSGFWNYPGQPKMRVLEDLSQPALGIFFGNGLRLPSATASVEE
jgi:hypothetical protein